ncbi:MAG: peptidylprolyl isomerase [Cytophagales bacterium]
MGLIGNIRKRRILLFSVLMLAISLFVIAMKFENGGGAQKAYVGEVNGKEIDYAVYNSKVENQINQAQNNAAQQGRTLQEYEINQIKSGVWQQIVTENTVLQEAKKIGLMVTNAELIDMVQGNNVVDQIKQSFSDPNTGVFDRTKVIQFLQNIAKADPNNQEAKAMKDNWMNFEKELPNFRLQEKYTELFTKSAYVTKAELERMNFAKNTKAVAKYVFIPYFSIQDTTVKASDEELVKYFESHKKQFTPQDDQAYIDFVNFAYKASKEDTAKVYAEITNLAVAFQNASNDTSFVNINSSSSANISAVKPSELPLGLTRNVPAPEQGKVYGPYLEYENYKLYKLGPLKQDELFSIKASHILFQAKGNTAADTAEALVRCTEVLNRIKKGESFEALAKEFGTDGTKDKGGDLGMFQENQMVKEFNDAVFSKGSVGLLNEPVKTQFGYHIIKITEPKHKDTKRIVYTLEKSLKPSTQTKDRMVVLAADFKKSLEGTTIDEVLKKPQFAGYVKTANIQVSKLNGYIGGLSNAESIVRWAYSDAKIGESADFQLPSGKVVAVLSKFKKKGEAKFEDVREEIIPLAKNSLKGDMILAKIKQLKSNTLEELVNGYGVQAVLRPQDTLSFDNPYLAGSGNEPELVGKLFGTKPGKKIEASKGEGGVLIGEKIADMPAQPVADYSTYRQQAKQNAYYKNMSGIQGALSELLGVEDKRYLFY